MEQYFIGHWELVEWWSTADGQWHAHPYGQDAQGELVYTTDGHMHTMLMQPDRTIIKHANLAKASPEQAQGIIRTFNAYAGSYHVEGDLVTHQVDFSLLPNWNGAELIRQFTFSKEHNELLLQTLPHRARNGAMIRNHLKWKRNI